MTHSRMLPVELIGFVAVSLVLRTHQRNRPPNSLIRRIHSTLLQEREAEDCLGPGLVLWLLREVGKVANALPLPASACRAGVSGTVITGAWGCKPR